MSCHPLPADPPVFLPPVWSNLPSDLQRRTVRLLAQLAYAQLRPHRSLTAKEIHHGQRTKLPQDPPRSS